MRTFFVSLFLLLFFSFSVVGQSFSGYITDPENKALPSAVVIGSNNKILATTNSVGFFTFDSPSDSLAVVVRMIGFRNQKMVLRKNAQVTIQLAPNIELETVTINAVRAQYDQASAAQTIGKTTIDQNFVGQDPIFMLEQLSPSVQTYSEAGTRFTNYGYIRMRGIDYTRINMTLNGVPLNDMLDGGVFFSNFTDFGNSVQSIQVQRGVGTSSNGTASYAGSLSFEAINLNTDSASGELQAGYGSFNTYRTSAEYNSGKQKNGFAYYAKYSELGTDGYRDNSGSRARSFFGSTAYFLPTSMIKITAFVGNTQNELSYLEAPESLINTNRKANLITPNETDNYTQGLLIGEFATQINQSTSLSASVYHGTAFGDFDVLFYGMPNADSVLIPDGTYQNGIAYRNQMHVFTMRNYHTGAFASLNRVGKKLNLTTGLHAYHFGRDAKQTIEPFTKTTEVYSNRTFKQEVSGFAKANYKINNRLSIDADLLLRGLNMEFVPIANQQAFLPEFKNQYFFANPKIGVLADVSENLSAFVSLGMANREPTRRDLLGGDDNIDTLNYLFIGNFDRIKPETVTDLELGIKYLKASTTIEANVFAMWFKNEIAPIGQRDMFGFYVLRDNVPNSTRQGIEIMANQKILKSLAVNANITFMRALISTYAPKYDTVTYKNVTPLLTPSVIGNVSVQYSDSKIRLALGTRFASKSYLQNENLHQFITPAYMVLFGSASYNFNKNISLALHADNLLSTHYYTAGNVVYNDALMRNEPAYFVNPPFNLFTTFSVKF